LCKPCLENLSGVRDFYKGFGNKNWQIISVTTDTDLPQVQQAVLKYHMDWMVGMAGPRRAGITPPARYPSWSRSTNRASWRRRT